MGSVAPAEKEEEDDDGECARERENERRDLESTSSPNVLIYTIQETVVSSQIVRARESANK